MVALLTRDCFVFEEVPFNVSVTELKGMGNSPAKWRLQNNAPVQLSPNPLPLPKMTEYFCRYNREGQVLAVLPLDRGNKSPYTLEDTFPDCTLGTSLHKLCHILLCIMLLIGHRCISTAYFCHCLMGKISIFPP